LVLLYILKVTVLRFHPKLLMRKKKIIISMNSLELLEQVLDLKKLQYYDF